jgi:SAM-dependent methyltransferase
MTMQMQMQMIHGVEDMKEAYRGAELARRYIAERFERPLGALLHARQAAALKRIIKERRPRRVLEIAPGPARLTAEIAPLLEEGGTIMDSSADMLDIARRRLEPVARAPWRVVQGDAFRLPFREEFDLVYSFRLIRHFADADRGRLYEQIARVLRPGGLLVFDAVNETVSAPIRARARADEYRHYDALLRPERIAAELAPHGLTVRSLEGVERRYPLLNRVQVLVAPRSRLLARLAMEVLDRVPGGEPLEWIVTARRG